MSFTYNNKKIPQIRWRPLIWQWTIKIQTYKMVVNELLLIEQEFQITYMANGVHNFRFYLHNNNLISYREFLRLRSILPDRTDLTFQDHVGVKFFLTNDLVLFSLFTSQEFSNLPYNIIMHNIKLNSNIHKHINPFSIAHNAEFAQFFTISDNTYHFPKSYLKYASDPDLIIHDSVIGYKRGIYEYDFNRPYVIREHVWDFYHQQDFKMKVRHRILDQRYLYYSRNPQLLRLWKFNNSEILNFTTNLISDRTYHGNSLYENNLFYEQSSRRFK